MQLLSELYAEHSHAGILTHGHAPLCRKPVILDDPTQDAGSQRLLLLRPAALHLLKDLRADSAVGVDDHGGHGALHGGGAEFSHGAHSFTYAFMASASVPLHRPRLVTAAIDALALFSSSRPS